MKFAKFFNRQVHHIVSDDGSRTLCNILLSEDFKAMGHTGYAITNYPYPEVIEQKPSTPLCSRCAKKLETRQ